MSGYNPYNAGATGYNNGVNLQQMDSDVNGNMMMGGDDGIEVGGGQSLDEIVNQNSMTMRRQSMPQRYPSHHSAMDADLRGLPMMEFTGNSPPGPLEHFSFDPSANMVQGDVLNPTAPMGLSDQNTQSQRRPSTGDLSLNTGFANAAHGYGSVLPHGSAYQSPSAPGNQSLDMDMGSPFISNPMAMSMDFSNSPNLASALAVDQGSMGLYGQAPFHPSMLHSSMSHGMHGLSQDPPTNVMERQRSRFENSQSRSSSDTSMAATKSQPSRSQSIQMPNLASQQSITPSQSQQQQQQQRHSTSTTPQRQDSHGTFPQAQNSQLVARRDLSLDRSRSISETDTKQNQTNPDWKTPEGGWPSTMAGRPHMQSEYKNAYSSTGFDMLGVLMRVATRPKPEINIGSVDFSCAFVVCDAEKDDVPIVYCSDNFERLTGYTRHMILGRNCRFLQSPDGHVESGVKRKYVDDDSVLYLKNMVNTQKEAQISLINYRRGGQPFMNLLTMIPITWDSDQVKFFVGFQVDLVEQPNAVTNRNPDGSYAINYQRGLTMPRYVMNAPETSQNNMELGKTIPRDDVSAILSTIGSGESEYAKRMWDKVLLENTDDVVHVLSLKGLFQWVSPSSLKVLEYEPGELIGTALSSVCHPSDIVPVTRELKDTSSGTSVNVVFRIRRKNSGYMWFEGHGSLHTEQGKGRKSIILVGRERPVYTLSKFDITANNGIGENELWTKMSTSGMFLYVSSNVRQLLDRQPDELIGVSIQSLMRADSKTDFVRILEHARTGKKASVKHEMINRRGQVLQAFTTLYPGDATEGQKPTFIVAQTRLIKYPRGNATNRPNAFSKELQGSESGQSVNRTPATHHNPSESSNAGNGDNTPLSISQYIQTDGNATTYGGNNGLALGRQDVSLASEDNLFDELKTTKSSSWQYEIRQLEKKNRLLAEEVQSLLAAKKKRKRRKGAGQMQKDCANCHTRVTPEWRRGPSGQRDLCNSCGLRWAKLNGRVSPRTTSDRASQASSPAHQPEQDKPHSAFKMETAGHNNLSRAATITSANHGHQNGGARSPQHGPGNNYSANMGGASGVPEKIEEVTEPD